MSLDFQAFLERLERVTRSETNPNEWRARCPAHEDRSPSLSVKNTIERILIRCHGGCSSKQIMAALGLREADLFHDNDHRTDPPLGDPIATHDYVDEDGYLLFQTLRFRPGGGAKTFRQRHKDPGTGQWVWNMQDVRRVLYRLPEVIKGVAEGKTIFVCEGEKDVEALRRIGAVATCNPMGAGKWRDEYATHLAGAKVAIIADKDEPGRAHADRIRNSLARQGMEKLWMLEAKIGNDASDHIKAGFGVKDFVPRRQRALQGIFTTAELVEVGKENLNPRSNPPSYPFSPVLPLNFRPGRLYAIAAYTSDGKTRFGLQGFRTLASLGHHVGYFSLEMGQRDLLNILIAHKGVPLELTEDAWRLRDDPAMYTLYNEALEEMRTWTAEMVISSNMDADTITDYTRDREYDVVVVDHLHRFAWDERRGLEQQLQKLTNLALDANVCLILLCQLRRHSGKNHFPEPSLIDLKETGAIEQEASMVLSLWRQRLDNVEPAGNTKIRVLKNRHTLADWDRAGHFWECGYDTTCQSFISLPVVSSVNSWDGSGEVPAIGEDLTASLRSGRAATAAAGVRSR